MPVSSQAQQLAQLMQAIQQQQAMAQMERALTQGGQLRTPQGGAQMSPSMSLPGGPQAGGNSPLLKQLMGGINPMGGPQGPPQPNTLGVNQPIPMQMPNPDPLGQQQGTPLPPNPTDMQGG